MATYAIYKNVPSNGVLHKVPVKVFQATPENARVTMDAFVSENDGEDCFQMVSLQFKQSLNPRRISRFVRRRGDVVLNGRGNAVCLPESQREDVTLVHNVKTQWS